MMDASDIRKEVFKWYGGEKRGVCDAQYERLTNNSASDIYREVKDDDERNSLFAKTDIVILTANNFERGALHQFSYENTGQKIVEIEVVLNSAIDFNKRVYAYSFSLLDYSVLHIHSRVTGSYTNGGAADAIRYVLSNELLQPTAIVSFGVCFGTEERDFNLGDVILSKKIYPYFVGAKVDGQELKVRDDNVFVIDDKLGTRIDRLKSNNKFRNFDFKIEYGNYITGEAVVSSADFRGRYVGITTQNILAGDMEAYALFKECNTPPYIIPCIVLKAICDWGIEKNFNARDEAVITDYYDIVEKCPNHEECKTPENEIVKTIDSLTDRLQAYAAKNSFVVLSLLLKEKVFAHSAYYDIKDCFVLKKFNGVACSSHWLRNAAEKYLSDYGYTVKDSFIKAVVSLLENYGIITNIESSNDQSESYDVSFSIIEDSEEKEKNERE